MDQTWYRFTIKAEKTTCNIRRWQPLELLTWLQGMHITVPVIYDRGVIICKDLYSSHPAFFKHSLWIAFCYSLAASTLCTRTWLSGSKQPRSVCTEVQQQGTDRLTFSPCCTTTQVLISPTATAAFILQGSSSSPQPVCDEFSLRAHGLSWVTQCPLLRRQVAGIPCIIAPSGA